MKISAKVGASTQLYMKTFHKSQQDPSPSNQVNPGLEKGNPARRVDPGWLLQSCTYFLQVDCRRVDPLRWVEVNPGLCKGNLKTHLTEVTLLHVNRMQKLPKTREVLRMLIINVQNKFQIKSSRTQYRRQGRV